MATWTWEKLGEWVSDGERTRDELKKACFGVKLKVFKDESAEDLQGKLKNYISVKPQKRNAEWQPREEELPLGLGESDVEVEGNDRSELAVERLIGIIEQADKGDTEEDPEIAEMEAKIARRKAAAAAKKKAKQPDVAKGDSQVSELLEQVVHRLDVLLATKEVHIKEQPVEEDQEPESEPEVAKKEPFQISRKGIWGGALLGGSWLLVFLGLVIGWMGFVFLAFFSLPVGVGLLVRDLWPYLHSEAAAESEEEDEHEKEEEKLEEEPEGEEEEPEPAAKKNQTAQRRLARNRKK